jgi:hypothetical protein
MRPFRINKIFPEIKILPRQDLDEAYDIVTATFDAAGHRVYRPAYLNSVISAGEFSRIFNVYENDTKYTFFVFSTRLDEGNVNKVLNSFSQPGDKSRVHFLSPYPLPGILNFIGKNSPAAFFELEAIRNLKNLENLADAPELLSHFSNILSTLAKKYFDLEIGYDIPQSLKNLEKLIINFYRNGEDYEPLQEVEMDYFPYYSLVLFGLYICGLLIRNFQGELFYARGQKIKEIGIGFSLQNNEMIDLMAHPIDKVFNFFFHGKDSSIINWYYELKYLFKK